MTCKRVRCPDCGRYAKWAEIGITVTDPVTVMMETCRWIEPPRVTDFKFPCNHVFSGESWTLTIWPDREAILTRKELR